MREKLIELLTTGKRRCWDGECTECEYDDIDPICQSKLIADYLIENGVVIPVRCPVCRYMRIKPFTLETFCSRTGETVYRDGYCIYSEPKESEE